MPKSELLLFEAFHRDFAPSFIALDSDGVFVPLFGREQCCSAAHPRIEYRLPVASLLHAPRDYAERLLRWVSGSLAVGGCYCVGDLPRVTVQVCPCVFAVAHRGWRVGFVPCEYAPRWRERVVIPTPNDLRASLMPGEVYHPFGRCLAVPRFFMLVADCVRSIAVSVWRVSQHQVAGRH